MDAKPVATPRDSRTIPPGSSSTAGPAHVDGYDVVKQYSKLQVLAAWVAVVVPMGLLAWVATPWLSHRLGGPDPFISALMLCFLVGLVWQLALLMLLVRHEQGSLQRSRVCAALWLRRPTNPRTRRTGGKVWWWAVPFVLLSAAINAGWIDPAGPIPRDLPMTLEMDRARLEHFFHGNWTAFGLLVAVALLAPIVEELFFRGLLLPRMRDAFGKADVVVNGLIFGLYHLHQPWSIAGQHHRRHPHPGLSLQAFPEHLVRALRPHHAELRDHRRRSPPRPLVTRAGVCSDPPTPAKPQDTTRLPHHQDQPERNSHEHTGAVPHPLRIAHGPVRGPTTDHSPARAGHRPHPGSPGRQPARRLERDAGQALGAAAAPGRSDLPHRSSRRAHRRTPPVLGPRSEARGRAPKKQLRMRLSEVSTSRNLRYICGKTPSAARTIGRSSKKWVMITNITLRCHR